jgi:hypothetical protein
VQLIYAEPHREDPRVTVITRGGVVKGEDRATQGKTTEESRVRKAAEKTERPKEILQKNQESGKLQRRHEFSMQRKKNKYLRRQEKNYGETKFLHRRHDQK